ncbi:hypothetical protein AC249_AIPGENE22381 [Exaiptasia diaphana]|nr:hypothetical protein AC249_AIPGENE22381 [Exaiptasia diaphana]
MKVSFVIFLFLLVLLAELERHSSDALPRRGGRILSMCKRRFSRCGKRPGCCMRSWKVCRYHGRWCNKTMCTKMYRKCMCSAIRDKFGYYC